MVYEDEASVGVALKRARNIEFIDQKQLIGQKKKK